MSDSTQDNAPSLQDNAPPLPRARTTPPSWQSKLCPILSIASMRAADPPRVIAGGAKPSPGPKATGCQGGACMFFIPQLDGQNRPDGDGVCAVTMLPLAVNVMTQGHGAIADQILQRLTAPISEPAASQT